MYIKFVPKLFVALLATTAVTNPESCQLPTYPTPIPSTSSTPVTTDSSTSRTSVDDSVNCPYLIESTPRGLSCLHCMQPEAREQAKIIVTTIAASCLKNVAINYLVDGTFSYDEATLKEHIDLLTSDGRRLFLHLYFLNGASQRRWKSTNSAGFAVKIDPEKFREKIQEDSNLREKYQDLVKKITPVIEYAASKGAVISVAPMLEDNLDNDSFEALAELTLKSLPPDVNVLMGRCPCPGCYDGNDHKIPSGFFRESHSIKNADNLKDSLITNDGDVTEFDFRNGNARNALNLDDLREARDASSKNNNVFILWTASYQGLYYDNNGSAIRVTAAKRKYAIPSMAEKSWLINFLRDGTN